MTQAGPQRGALIVAGSLLLLSAAVTPALAHLPIEGVGGFTGGLLHPILVPVHALALVALGLFVGQQRERRAPLIVFAAALIAGLVAIAFAVGETSAMTVLLTSTIVAGVLVAVAWPMPAVAGWTVAAVIGASLALDSPPQATTIAEGNAMLAGTAIGACLALLAVVMGSSLATHRVAKLAVRVLGSWIAASAALVLAVVVIR